MDLADGKQILIAGATGLIGQELTRSLVGLDYHVMVLTRNPAKVKGNLPKTVGYLEWNGTFTNKLVREVEKSFAVINLAGEGIASKRWNRRRRFQLVRSRLGTTHALAKACQYANPKPSVFIQASAIGYYPNSDFEIFNEHSPCGSDFLSRLSADWEAIANHEVPQDVRLIILRTGIILSNKGGMLPKLIVPINFYAGGWLGSGEQVVSWIHLHDEVNAILYLLERHDAKGPFNLVAPNPVTQKILVKQVAKNLHRPAYTFVPRFIVRWFFGEMGKEIMLSNQNIEPKKLKELGFEFSFPTIADAIDNLAPK